MSWKKLHDHLTLCWIWVSKTTVSKADKCTVFLIFSKYQVTFWKSGHLLFLIVFQGKSVFLILDQMSLMICHMFKSLVPHRINPQSYVSTDSAIVEFKMDDLHHPVEFVSKLRFFVPENFLKIMAGFEYSGCVWPMDKRYSRAHYLFSLLIKFSIQFNYSLSFSSFASQSLASTLHQLYVVEIIPLALEKTDSKWGCLEGF